MQVFICVFLSTYAENISLLDSMVYCSNAFTSNGYGLVNATNHSGKILSLILVWSGYILSGVTTALLTLAVISRYYKKRFSNLKARVRKQDAQLKDINAKLDLLLENK